jgi:hypothetical protein
MIQRISGHVHALFCCDEDAPLISGAGDASAFLLWATTRDFLNSTDRSRVITHKR